ncbi:MAG TPA: hypothetical protein VJU61_16820 [Polyangiaceae bacterium]|nr:hypothetical protein [Polyangiaceae bacterium]
MNNHDVDDRDGEGGTEAPSLFIPYWTKPLANGLPRDDGTVRPLPDDVASGVVGWLCPSIQTTEYTPGADLTVRVEVGNTGGGSASSLAIVSVWWSEPHAAFSKSDLKLLGTVTIAVPPRGQTRVSPAITGVIATASEHVCVLARVTHPLDALDPAHQPPIDPHGSRHWAQRNLLHASPSTKPMTFPFLVGNPFQREEEFELRVRPVGEATLGDLARMVGADPVILQDIRAAFVDTRDLIRSATREVRESHSLVLGAGVTRSLAVSIELSEMPSRGEFSAFQILQYRRGDRRIVGSLGVIVEADGNAYDRR